MVQELHYSKLKHFYTGDLMSIGTTSELKPYYGMIGQERAERALSFGLNIKTRGYNIYVSGPPGTGKTTFAISFSKEIASSERVPEDLCYVYNFKKPKYPQLVKFPAGGGKVFAEEMNSLIDSLSYELPKVFANKDFESRKGEILKTFQAQRDEKIREMTDDAKEMDFGVKSTNSGIYFMPIIEGEVISEEQYDNLDQDVKDAINQNSDAVQERAAEVMRDIKEFEKNTRKEIEDLEYQIGLFTVGRFVGELLEKYEDNDVIIAYLMDVKEDILNNIEEFDIQENEEEEALSSMLPWYSKRGGDEAFAKYRVNVLTDNSETKGAPVIIEHNPIYSNLVGEVEYDNEYGNFSTDFMKIKPGALHKANGGYLILQAYDVFSSVHAWEGLRRVLNTGEIVIEPLREYTTGVAVSSIKPEPIPVDVKVILVGTGYYYDLIYDFDDNFQKLFKIRADFDYEMDITSDNINSMLRFIKGFVETEKCGEFDSGAVAKVIEYASRIAERQDKLTTQFSRIAEILSEASAWAAMDGAETVNIQYVQKAIAEREYRLNMYEEKLSDMIKEDTLLIRTTGEKVGQINGLAVLDTGDYAFAKPSRITATTYVGRAGIVNIEKEAEMSGSIHDKGVQVLTGYLGYTYAQDFPLSLSCRVCFEQNYSGIDGDSASSTELYAVLSSLSELPIKQGLAVTGSINQYGEIQPIGGVSYKIEGFFEVCKNRGLTGDQGVIIPQQNVRDLVLKDEVVEAVKDGLFHIYPIAHVDEGIELLTGLPVGKKDARGRYPADSVHGKVFKKLKKFHKKSLAEED